MSPSGRMDFGPPKVGVSLAPLRRGQASSGASTPGQIVPGRHESVLELRHEERGHGADPGGDGAPLRRPRIPAAGAHGRSSRRAGSGFRRLAGRGAPAAACGSMAPAALAQLQLPESRRACSSSGWVARGSRLRASSSPIRAPGKREDQAGIDQKGQAWGFSSTGGHRAVLDGRLDSNGARVLDVLDRRGLPNNGPRSGYGGTGRLVEASGSWRTRAPESHVPDAHLSAARPRPLRHRGDRSGGLAFRYRGQEVLAPAGWVNLAFPGEAHSGRAAGRDGWTYRMFYLDPSQMTAVARALDPRVRELPFIAAGAVWDPALAARLASLHGPAKTLAWNLSSGRPDWG